MLRVPSVPSPRRSVRSGPAIAGLVLGLALFSGCAGLDIRCDGGGKGYSCRSVNEPPERHTRSPHQPAWADEYHDIGIERPTVAEHVFTRTNAVRTGEGGSALQHERTLSQIACWHNQDMLAHNYMGHVDSDDRLPGGRVEREHRRLIGTASENAQSGGKRSDDSRAWGTSIVGTWMRSPGHRENLMRERWTHLGVCVTVNAKKAYRAAQVFARIYAYFDKPLPWTVAPGTSMSVSVSLVTAESPPSRYAFVPVDQQDYKTFRRPDAGRPFSGVLEVPSEPGRYDLHLHLSDADGGGTTVSGPRVWVKPADEPGY